MANVIRASTIHKMLKSNSFFCHTPPSIPLRLHCAKKENWGNKIDVKKNRLWLDLRDYTNKTSKQKHKRQQENNHTKCNRAAYALIHTLPTPARGYENMPAKEVPSRTSQSTKFSICYVYQNTFRGRNCQFTSRCHFNLIATKISVKYH